MISLDNLEPISRESTPSIIAATIRRGIYDGMLAPGMQLAEADLATRFGVSRGPLREAMQRLVQEGLLRSERHRGIFVPVLSRDDIADIYVARNAIEQAAFRILARTATEEDFDHLDSIVGGMRTAAANEEWETMAKLDLSFHTAVVEGCKSPRLNRMFQTLHVETMMSLRALEDLYAERLELVEPHANLLKALRARDEKRLTKLVDAHSEDSMMRLEHTGRLPA